MVVRDNIIITPALRDKIPTVGPVDALIITGIGFTEPIDVGFFGEGIAMLSVAASGGNSPTLDCDLQYGYRDTANQYHFVDSGDSFTQLTTNGMGFKKFTANFGKYIRFRLKIGGTNSPTYTVTMRVALKG